MLKRIILGVLVFVAGFVLFAKGLWYLDAETVNFLFQMNPVSFFAANLAVAAGMAVAVDRFLFFRRTTGR